MFKSDRNGDTTRGLIVGFLVGVLFCICASLLPATANEVIGDNANNPNYATHNSNQCSNGNEPVWGPWLGLCFGLYDTIAQWMMMGFTIIAAGLLYGTLRQANKTNDAATKAANAALEANQIMRDEQRPWLKFEVFHAGYSTTQGGDEVVVSLVNRGASPARDVLATVSGIEASFDEVEVGAVEMGERLADIIFPNDHSSGYRKFFTLEGDGPWFFVCIASYSMGQPPDGHTLSKFTIIKNGRHVTVDEMPGGEAK